MDLNGQLYILATLLLEQEAQWAQELVWTLWGRENLFTLVRI
jgi:hypothetical protein